MATDLEALGQAIKRTQDRHHRALDTEMIAVGTTLVQWNTLRAINRKPGSSAHDLALETFQSDQSFGTLANRLEERGLITRKPGDGRRIEHHLTPDGEAMLAKGRPLARKVLMKSFAHLSEDDRATLLRLLTLGQTAKD